MQIATQTTAPGPVCPSWWLVLPKGFFNRCVGGLAIAPGPTHVLSAAVAQAVGFWWFSWFTWGFPPFRKPHCTPCWSSLLWITLAPEMLALVTQFFVHEEQLQHRGFHRLPVSKNYPQCSAETLYKALLSSLASQRQRCVCLCHLTINYSHKLGAICLWATRLYCSWYSGVKLFL